MSERDPWASAVRIGTRLAGAGQAGLTRAEVEAAVAGLREAAARAPALIAGVTRLPPTPSDPIDLVVGRGGIIAANAAASKRMIEAAARAHPDLTPRDLVPPAPALGGILAILSRRVLGQFDPFGSPPRLLLVAPNIVRTERALGADPADFRLWVCLHEQTHRAQFGAAPWLVDHLLGLVGELVSAEADQEALADDLPRRVRAWLTARRTDPRAATSVGLLTAVSSPRMAAALDRVTAVMSLLEGYADVMMDEVGPSVIATLPSIRAGFDAHRARGGVGALVGKLIGMDAKLAQYSEGASFCRAVIDQAGLDTLNRAFDQADYLPSLEELRDPHQWVARIPPKPEPAPEPSPEAPAAPATGGGLLGWWRRRRVRARGTDG